MNVVKLAPLLLIFAEVAKQKSFTGAAKTLAMSKSAISQQIKRLETAVEMQLLARNTRGVVLTTNGEALLSRCEVLAEQLNCVVTDVQQVKVQPSGRFAVSVPPFFERNIVVPAIKQLCIEFPKIEPDVEVTGRWRDLIEHRLDAAIFGGDLKDCEYKAQSIGRVHDVFCASPDYLKQYGQVNSLTDLTDRHKFIATPWQQGAIQLCSGEDILQHQLSQSAYTNSLNTLIDMVSQGMGVGLLPSFVASQRLNQSCLGTVVHNNLVHVLPQLKGRDWHFYYMHRYNATKPAHVSRFYELVKHYFDGVAA